MKTWESPPRGSGFGGASEKMVVVSKHLSGWENTDLWQCEKRVRGVERGIGAAPIRSPKNGAFYIFTIIKIVTRSIVILTMPLTYLPSLKIAYLPFATFARLARHGDTTRWRPVSRAMQKDQPTLAYLLKKRNLFCNEFVMAFLFE